MLKKAMRGVRINKRRKSVFLRSFAVTDLPDETQALIKTLAVTYSYKVWTQLKMF
jgi:hypothetical protein